MLVGLIPCLPPRLPDNATVAGSGGPVARVAHPTRGGLRDRLRPPGQGGGRPARAFCLFLMSKNAFPFPNQELAVSLDPRSARADLQDRQASHRHPPAPTGHDLAADIRTAFVRAARPDLIALLLGRAAGMIHPDTKEAPK